MVTRVGRIVATTFMLVLSLANASSAGELIAGDVLSHFKNHEQWEVAYGIKAVAGEKRFAIDGSKAGLVLYNGLQQRRAPYLFTAEEFEDVELSLQFMVPMGSNAGVYFMGRYEIQILDSFGKDKITFTDLGGVYQRWRTKAAAQAAGLPQGFEGVGPRVNAAKAPGQWQQLDVVFRAPRFDDETGDKIANARFESVHVNGQLVQENVEVTGPTRAAPLKGEEAKAAIAIQGDHGPLAIRSYRVKAIQRAPQP